MSVKSKIVDGFRNPYHSHSLLAQQF